MPNVQNRHDLINSQDSPMPIFASQKRGVSFYGPWLANIILSIASTTKIMNFVALHPDYHMTDSPLHCLAFIALYSLATHCFELLLGVFQSQSALHSNIKRCLGNINNNNTLYHTVTVGLIIAQEGPIFTHPLLHSALELYLVGRVVFAIGYLVGTIVNVQSLRSYGFGLTVASIVTMVNALNGRNFIAQFVF